MPNSLPFGQRGVVTRYWQGLGDSGYIDASVTPPADAEVGDWWCAAATTRFDSGGGIQIMDEARVGTDARVETEAKHLPGAQPYLVATGRWLTLDPFIIRCWVPGDSPNMSGAVVWTSKAGPDGRVLLGSLPAGNLMPTPTLGGGDESAGALLVEVAFNAGSASGAVFGSSDPGWTHLASEGTFAKVSMELYTGSGVVPSTEIDWEVGHTEGIVRMVGLRPITTQAPPCQLIPRSDDQSAAPTIWPPPRSQQAAWRVDGHY